MLRMMAGPRADIRNEKNSFSYLKFAGFDKPVLASPC
jgi:hypothetical protein